MLQPFKMKSVFGSISVTAHDADRNSAFRVGAGGDSLSFNTLNGNIYVRKASK
jgi:hypothetical protein